ncbi:MAG: wcaJ 1 [Lacunisphaera sp.]|nr:wcaJ 1 [Lacunisphaera sp.]
MITNRHRGLGRIHGIVVILVVAGFFRAYAEVTIRYLSTWMKLSREVNLLPYFLCVVIGMLAANGRLRQLQARLTRLGGADAAGLATAEVALMAFAIFSMMFATQDRSISRLFLGTFLLWSWLGLIWLHRRLPRLLARLLYGQGPRIPTLFIGRAESLAHWEEWLVQRSHLGVQPAGFVSLDTGETRLSEEGYLFSGEGKGKRLSDEGYSLLGSNPPIANNSQPITNSPQPITAPLRELPRLLAERGIAQVILMELPADEKVAREIIDHCQAHGCRLLLQHRVDELLGHPVVSVDEGGHHFFTLHEEPLEEPLNRAIKRIFDIIVALPVVVFVLPWLVMLVAVMQRRQAPGPLFHARPRSGERRVQFRMLKFRSMRLAPVDERAEGRQACADDGRIYPFGHFLRRHSLDEFPQFWNVFTGEMSIVGPRPVMPSLDEEFERQVRAYRSKHWVKPGITGLAQSAGFRGEIKTPAQLQERIRLDLHYIAHWSLWLDVQITARTAGQIFFPPASAY